MLLPEAMLMCVIRAPTLGQVDACGLCGLLPEAMLLSVICDLLSVVHAASWDQVDVHDPLCSGKAASLAVVSRLENERH